MSGAGEKTDTEKPRKDRGGDRRDVARSPGTPGAPGAGRGREDPPLELRRELGPRAPRCVTSGLRAETE